MKARSWKTPWFAAAAAAVVVLSATALLDSFARTASRVEARSAITADADALARNLSDVVARESAAVETLAAFVEIARNDPERLAKDFPVFAEAVLAQGRSILSIQLAPDSILEYVYPIKGNEAAVGLDLMADPDRKALLTPAIASGDTVIQGPVGLVQGGVGILVRRPTYNPDGSFWGFSAVVLDWPGIEHQTEFKSHEGVVVGLRRQGEDKILAGEAEAFEAEPVIRELRVGGTDTFWELAIRPAEGWPSAAAETPLVWGAGFSLSVLAAILAFGIARQPAVLRRERQLAIEDLAQAEARHQATFHHAGVGIVVAARSGEILTANPAFRDIVGLPQGGQVGGRNVHEFIDPRFRRGYIRKLIQLSAGGGAVEHEMTIAGDGLERWCRVRLTMMSMGPGTDPMFVGVVEDATERQRALAALGASETRYRDLFESAPIAIQREDYLAARNEMLRLKSEGWDLRARFEADHKLVGELLKMVSIVDANPFAFELQSHLGSFGSHSSLGDRLTPESLPTYVETLLAIAEGRNDLELSVTTRAEDGSLMYLVVRWRVPMVDGSPDYSAVIVTIADATSLRETEGRLQMLLASKDRFLASVAHELRTPLTAVVGFARELLDQSGVHSLADRAEFLSLIGFHSNEMAHLIEDLLVVARADIGEVRVLPERVNVAALVLETIHSLPDVVIPVLAPDGELYAWADPTRLRQIMRNLCTNAVRYGGDEVTVAVRRVEGDTAVVEVGDNGPALSAADIRRIFEPYERSNSVASLPGSIGLGLTVSRALARLQGGDLDVVRSGGKNVFRVSLPLVMTAESGSSRAPIA